MRMARFEPWSTLDLMHRDFNRLATNAVDKQWLPAVDIIEESGRFVLRADVPGVAPEDIDVSLDGGILTISGVRSAEARDEGASIMRSERSAGRFSRRFTLPETTDAETVAARCNNGILEVSIPKQPEVQPRRIRVEAA